MKKLVLFAICLYQTSQSFSQGFNQSNSCNVNINSSQIDSYRRTLARSVVKLILERPNNVPSMLCSGTLLRVNGVQNRFYILSAAHCVSDIDFNSNDHRVILHYQSPNGNTLDTKPSNQGIGEDQSKSLDDDDYEYFLTCRLRKVSAVLWGYFTLLELLNRTNPEVPFEIPPHFRPYYAGWTPNLIQGGIPGLAIMNAVAFPPPPHMLIHHPFGDIKKASQTNLTMNLSSPYASTCYTVTRVIEFLLGWIWRGRLSTSVVCNYVDNPWMNIVQWGFGHSEGGSSGSGYFGSNNRAFGILSGGVINTCNGLVNRNSFITKFRNNYHVSSVKNSLNPPGASNRALVDQFGIEGTEIFCHDALNNLQGFYFPANHVQPENAVVLRSGSDASIVGDGLLLRVITGADYTIQAAGSIVSNPNGTLETQPNVRFLLNPGTPCNAGGRLAEEVNQFPEIDFYKVQLPKTLTFNPAKYKSLERVVKPQIEIYPNPGQDEINLTVDYLANSNVEINVYDSKGKLAISQTSPWQEVIKLNTSNLKSGIYRITCFYEGKRYQKNWIKE